MAVARQYVEKEFYTEEEYFEIERTSFGRWEYVHGEVRLMAGGSDDHGAISSNIGRTLGNSVIPKGCRVYGSDIKIHTGDGINTFPDAAVVCGNRLYYGSRTDIITNPLVIVEVLSPSTEGYDRTDKFDHYKTIESLQDYLLAEQDEARVMLYSRHEDHWEFREATGQDSTIYLPSVETALALADIYALIEFNAE